MECKEDHLLEAAKALILLRSTPRPDRPPASATHLLKPHPFPPTVMPVTSIENVLSVFLPQWGLRQRRSRYTGMTKREKIEAPPTSAAAAASCGHRSPDTPLDLEGGSDPSTSGSDGFPSSSEIPPFKRFRAGETPAPGCDTRIKRIKVSEVERSPLVEGIRPSSQPIKRQCRKKTKSELQEEERFLLEDKERLIKILEFEMIGRNAILEENRRLLIELANSQRTPAEAEPEKLKFVLPDLNEPAVLECLEPDCAVNNY